jgi:hypothetical protein
VQDFNDLMIQQVSYIVVNKFNIWFCVRESELSIHLKSKVIMELEYNINFVVSVLVHFMTLKYDGQLYFRV